MYGQQVTSQVLSRGYKANLYWVTTNIFEVSKTTVDLDEIFENCTSVKEEEQLEVVLRGSERVVSWETTELFTIPRSKKKTGHLMCKPSALVTKRQQSGRKSKLGILR